MSQKKIVKITPTEYEKPILKWVGGKTQILDKILKQFPETMDSYHEIFVGGGSVLLGFLTLVKQKKIKVNKVFAYDLNSELIALYKNIQLFPKNLYNEVDKLIEKYYETFDDEEDKAPEEYYYDIRTKYNKLVNKSTLVGSAMFIFLNKTCFRGLYRVGPNGFNVPYGNYKKPEIINKNHLLRVSCLIKDVEFIQGDFETTMKNIKEDDFTYLDPPYAPESKTSFVGYNKTGFSLQKHEQLFKLCKNLDSFIMSNSCVELVLDAFPEDDFEIDKIQCKRSINSKKPESKTMEVIIKK